MSIVRAIFTASSSKRNDPDDKILSNVDGLFKNDASRVAAICKKDFMKHCRQQHIHEVTKHYAR